MSPAMRSRIALYHIFIIFCIHQASSEEDESKLCPLGEWPCDNKECIRSSQLCDGVAHCADGSDEIAANCISEDCPQYAFQCAYGACVAGTGKCDKKKDCADNSDELEIQCDNTTAVNIRLQGSCSDYELQCDSGVCVKSGSVCDGVPDCVNGEDETVEVCGGSVCPSYAFRCGYGACVSGAAKCNGIADCVDNSDEAASLCGTARVFKASTPATSLQMPGGCMLPTDRKNMIFRNTTTKELLPPGSIVPEYQSFDILCEPGYFRVDQQSTKFYGCFFGNLPPMPYCKKYCSNAQLFSNPSFSPKSCKLDNKPVPCDGPLSAGTRVTMECNLEFTFVTVGSTQWTCESNFEWSGPKPRCNLQCGQLAPELTAFAKGGIQVLARKVPWNVAIFRDASYECSGTIVSPNLVITAAHCFWDEANSKPFNKKLFLITAGSEYKEFSKATPEQTFNISDIQIEDYQGYKDNFKNDLALVRVEKYFKFSDTVRPACRQFEERERAPIRGNIEGTFTGWGIVGDVQQEVLQSVLMRTVTNNECGDILKEIGSENYELADDKFCLKDDYGKTACRGDSGSGFIQLRNGKYHVTGVISHAPAKVQDCAKNGVVTLTNINYLPSTLKLTVNNDLAKY